MKVPLYALKIIYVCKDNIFFLWLSNFLVCYSRSLGGNYTVRRVDWEELHYPPYNVCGGDCSMDYFRLIKYLSKDFYWFLYKKETIDYPRSVTQLSKEETSIKHVSGTNNSVNKLEGNYNKLILPRKGSDFPLQLRIPSNFINYFNVISVTLSFLLRVLFSLCFSFSPTKLHVPNKFPAL